MQHFRFSYYHFFFSPLSAFKIHLLFIFFVLARLLSQLLYLYIKEKMEELMSLFFMPFSPALHPEKENFHICGWFCLFQLDFQLPSRFNLSYTAEDENKRERPVMIHRAILGSVERMFAILLEHYKGKWPFWLSPRQSIVCPVSEKSQPYALEVSFACPL